MPQKLGFSGRWGGNLCNVMAFELWFKAVAIEPVGGHGRASLQASKNPCANGLA